MAVPMDQMVPSDALNQPINGLTRYGNLRGYHPAGVAKFDHAPSITRGLASDFQDPNDGVIDTQPGLEEVALYDPFVQKLQGPFTVKDKDGNFNVETGENYYDEAWECVLKDGEKPTEQDFEEFKAYYDKLTNDYASRGRSIYGKYGYVRAFVARNSKGKVDFAVRTGDDDRCCGFRELYQARRPNWDYKTTCTRKDCDDCQTREDEVRVRPYFRKLFCCVCCPRKYKHFGTI